MLYPHPLVRGTLLRRYKRFLADVVLEDGTETIAHCANPGAMLGTAMPGSEIWLERSTNPARKLGWSWELIRIGDHLVGINTARPNALVAEAIAAGAIPELADYATQRAEVRYGVNSRIDLLLEAPGRPICYVEVKNVHLLRQGSLAEFPDCVTARGAKHLVELAAMVAAGHRAVMLYLVQRGDCHSFAIARDLDPRYEQGLRRASAAGVETLCYACRITVEGIAVSHRLPILLDQPDAWTESKE
ncbi:MAG TPA: DNA/RNA nuclease SfsA [Stellaceae bacterium]|nr:DNA/RNA nuclease SfsA [Stellaceae bacterium]